jgi:hypothetical protein
LQRFATVLNTHGSVSAEQLLVEVVPPSAVDGEVLALQKVITACCQVGEDGGEYEARRVVVQAASPCVCTVLALVSMHGYLFELLAGLPDDNENEEAALQV